jgi:hypothetical protein
MRGIIDLLRARLTGLIFVYSGMFYKRGTMMRKGLWIAVVVSIVATFGFGVRLNRAELYPALAGRQAGEPD